MKLYRLISTAAISGALSLGLTTVALADDSASIHNTGPDSTNTATVNNDNTFTWTDNSSVTVTNTNTQTATTGDATVSGNTTGGNATTGEASNSNQTTTTINMDPGNTPGPVGGGNAPGGSQGGGNVGAAGGSGGVGGSSSLQGSGGGVGGGVLPETGPDSPLDVSALRTSLPNGPAADLVKQTNRMSTLLLAAGALLSLLGAIGSAIYANKQESKVRG